MHLDYIRLKFFPETANDSLVSSVSHLMKNHIYRFVFQTFFQILQEQACESDLKSERAWDAFKEEQVYHDATHLWYIPRGDGMQCQ